MSANTLPLHTAHQHAANAEDYLGQGLLIPAAEEHFQAAEAFLVCVEKSDNDNTKRTLQMLHSDQLKAGKDIERRIAKLREENQDPSLPQKVSPLSKAQSRSAMPSGSTPSTSQPNHTAPIYASTRMGESHNNVDESFMMLGQQSDPGDAFNNFWRTMEGMLDNLSQPVAFATAPLGTEPHAPRREESTSSDTDGDELPNLFSWKVPMSSKRRTSKAINPGYASSNHAETARQAQGRSREETDEEEVFAEDGNESSESFCLIPSGSETSSSLKAENTALKGELEAVRKQLDAASRVIQLRKDQDQQLRDSIVLARHQAQRAMGASLMLSRATPGPSADLSALNLNLPAVPTPMTPATAGRDREAQLLRRIRELEEEVRAVRTENEKQKVMITRFREKWEKLKESAKRKKDAKAASEVTRMVARDRIDEEPEVEQQLDEAFNAR